MGELKNRRIVQSRIWLDPNEEPLPLFDYDYSYPITVFDAVKKTMDDNSSNLTDELNSIYRLIASKQDMVEPGIPDQLMTWTGMRGQIGAMELAKSINTDPSLRSHKRIPTERAIGDMLDTKVPLSSFNIHINDGAIHITDAERIKWNSMAPLSSLQAHINNSVMHITDAERQRWNNKADNEDFEKHIYDFNNPHNTTAHQVGTYTRKELDEMFKNIRESFFNYKNISWDERSNSGTLVEYHPANWNPNYILGFNDELPDVPDSSQTYFALKPATDYTTNESQDCIIYIKRPGMVWQEVGLQNMSVGDMVIRYPDTSMFVWVQGRFIKLFTGNNDAELPGGNSDMMWRPLITEDGKLGWIRSKEIEPPEPMEIKGKDGYTPIKGIDYVDGKDGQGVPIGGISRDVLVKLTDENFDTTWKSLIDIFNDMVIAGEILPAGLVEWNSINGRPEWYRELGPNHDGFITQGAVTKEFERVGNNLSELHEKADQIPKIKQDLSDHINDFNNPHRTTPSQIGAVPIATFTDHVNNFNNPHNVKPSDIGLGNVDDTKDIDKPISNPTQSALDALLEKINIIRNEVARFNFIGNVSWNNRETKLTFTFRDGTELDIVIPILDIFNGIYFDEVTKDLVIVLPDESEHRINLSKLLQIYIGSKSDNIQVVVNDDNSITATIIPGSVGELEIMPSVHFRGSPTTTTQAVSDNSTRVATTEFVHKQVIDDLISYNTDRPLSANMGRILNQRKADIDDVIELINDLEKIDIIDNLESTNPEAALSANMGRHLDLTKAPRVHTSPSGSTFGRATISLFGHARASDVDPLMDGTVFRGTDDGYFARGDHRHPTDITRAPMHWPDVAHDQYELTGEPKSVNPPDDSNNHRIATTEWVRRNAVGVNYGTCPTAAATAIKVVTLQSTYVSDPVPFIRQKGSTVVATFTNGNTAANMKLNVQNTGAAPVLYGGKAIVNDMIKAGYSYEFTFDGTNWLLINPTGTHVLPDSDNSNSLVSSAWVRRNAVGVNKGYCETGSTTAAKVVTLRSTFMDPVVFIRQIGSTVSVAFTNQDWSGDTDTTMNVQNTGAAPIRFASKKLINGMIGTAHEHIFTFDGTYWQLQNPVPGTGYGTIRLGPGSN